MIYLFEDGILADMPYAPGPVTDIHGMADIEYVDLWWTDPTDRLWGGTVIVRKEGDYPQSVNDGTIVFESTKRNAYKYDENIMGFRDEGLDEQTTYYYSFFTRSRKHQYDLAMPGHFSATTGKKYAITFVSEEEILQQLRLLPGEMPSYSGSLERNKAGDRNFDTWSPSFYAADKDQTYTAVFNCLLHYKNDQGGVDLYTEQVRHGANGTWSGSASKERDNYYIYTFEGWSGTQGGSAEADCRLNLQEDRTVYAAYSASTRTYTVTFMNGSSVYATVQVAYGQNAVCPKADPGKASTAQYSYSFVGWNSYDGAMSASSTILQNIKADKTVYAAYSRTTRSYTVTFMNGSTVWDRDTVLYGGTASPDKGNPSKASSNEYNYAFVGWNSYDGASSASSGILSNIQSDKTVYAAYSSSPRYYTVTFMNGTSVWDTDSVPYNGTAVCSRGNPSRASTTRYSYSFEGWALSNGATSGSATILQNIRSDKTVYAAFRQSTRTYTITWKDWDGYSLGSTQAAYGSTPRFSGTPNFGGWKFKSWSPSISSVTGSATYTATYTMPTGMSETISKSWDEIISDSKNGSTSGYTTGATKIAVLSDRTPICFELAGIDKDSAGHFTFIAKTLYGSSRWNNTRTAEGGYVVSALRSYLQNTYGPKLPSNIRNAVKTVTKYCNVNKPKNANESYTDKYWTPNCREMNMPVNKETMGPQYTYYNSDSKRIRYEADGSAAFMAYLSSDSSTYTASGECAMAVSVISSDGHFATSNGLGVVPVIIGFVL